MDQGVKRVLVFVTEDFRGTGEFLDHPLFCTCNGTSSGIFPEGGTGRRGGSCGG